MILFYKVRVAGDCDPYMWV